MATVRMPISEAARITRIEISLRFATRMLRIGFGDLLGIGICINPSRVMGRSYEMFGCVCEAAPLRGCEGSPARLEIHLRTLDRPGHFVERGANDVCRLAHAGARQQGCAGVI